MLQFSNVPPVEATRAAFRLIRTPARGQLHLYVTSPDLLGCFTHYFAGRTVPCSGANCEPCDAGSSARWHAYVAAIDPATNEPLILETTAAGAEQLAAYKAKHGTLRGCDLIATRVAPRPNARLRLRMKPLDLAHIDLPKPLNLIPALCHVWGIPVTETTTTQGTYSRTDLAHRGTAAEPDRGAPPPARTPTLQGSNGH